MAFTFVKKIGAPAGTITINIGNQSFIIDDSANPTISTDSVQVADDLKLSPYLQFQGGSRPFTPIPSVTPVVAELDDPQQDDILSYDATKHVFVSGPNAASGSGTDPTALHATGNPANAGMAFDADTGVPFAVVSESAVGAADGVAPLGPDEIVPDANLPATIVGSPGLRPDGAIAESFPIWSWGNPTTGPSLTTGNLRVCRLDDVVGAGKTITSITVISASGDAVTQTHLWFALYRASDRALLAVTGDDLANGWLGGTAKKLNLSVPYVATADFVPVVGIVQVAATPSKLITAGAIASNTMPDALSTLFTGASVGGNAQNTGLNVPGDAPNPYTAPATGALRSPFYCFLS